MAARALQDVSAAFPVMFPGFVSPNRTRSFRCWITCSRVTVRVCVSTLSLMVFTRHTMPFPGSVSSCSQSLMLISGASGPRVSVAVLFFSSRVRLMASGRT